MKLFLSFILLLSGLYTNAQQGQLSGEITAAGKPLKGIQLELRKTNIRAETDSSGRFQFKGIPAGKYQLTAGGTGYFQQTMPVAIIADSTVQINMVLKADADDLNEIVVTGTMKVKIDGDSEPNEDLGAINLKNAGSTGIDLYEGTTKIGNLSKDNVLSIFVEYEDSEFEMIANKR